jgi:RNA polymerase sigma factor (sigma-70 family)
VTPATAGGLTDADLLRRWVTQRDEAAFETLLWRHAPAVLGVCRRVLGDVHEAEDAAQAAFLTLARKAGAIGRRQAVAAWIYTVAYRTATRARTRLSRAVLFPPQALDALPARQCTDPVWRDLRPVLDEEVSRLPEKFRAVFVLCHVEGRTNEDAARELCCPVGTVMSRLTRARQRLRDRLTRRGLTLGVLTAVAAGEVAATAAAPSALVLRAVRAATLAASGKSLAGVVSTEVVALSEGVVRAMLLTKMKGAAAVVLGLVLLGGGGGLVSYRTAAGEPRGGPRDTSALAQRERTAPVEAEREKLKDLLAQKEKELSDLKVRLEKLDKRLKITLQTLDTFTQEHENAEKALAAERAARQAAEAERRVAERQALQAAADAARPDQQRPGYGYPGANEMPNRSPSADREAQIDQARDDVELLEAQVGIKKAQLKATRLSLDSAQKIEQVQVGQGKIGAGEVAAMTGQLEIKEAELRESQVRLELAKRRLSKLQGPAKPGSGSPDQQMSQRAAELEKKLDALRKELDGLRKELDRGKPSRP